MNKIIDTLYIVLGIGVIGFLLLVGIVGIMRIWRDINNIKDNEQIMEYTNTIDMGWDMTLGLVVLLLYIVGKVWMYYKINDNEGTKNKSNPEQG